MIKIKYFTLLILMISLDVQSQQKNEQKKNVEVIEVIGSVPLSVVRKELESKRFAFMDFFNANVSDDDLKFVCKKESRPGSHIKRNVCRNAYDIRIRQALFEQEIRSGTDIATASILADVRTAENDDRDKDKIGAIQKMLTAKQEFFNVYSDFKATETKFKKVHRKTFGKLSKYKEKEEELASN